MSSEPSDICIELQPELAAYALGESEASAELLDHLAACPDCQRDLSAYVQVARMLPFDAPEAVPPPELRERILGAVARASAPAAPTPAEPRPPAPQAAAPQQRRWRWPAFRPALALALAAVVALLGWNVSLQSQLSAQAAQIGANRDSWQTMIVLLNDPAVRWYQLAGAAATGHFWAAPDGQTGCLVAQGLPPLADGQVYQVWLSRAGERTSGGVFEGRNGNGWVLIRSSEPLTGYQAVDVTVEPRGGSAWPTGPQVLQGALAEAQAWTAADRQLLLPLLEPQPN